MVNHQSVSEGDILKGIIRQRRLTQEKLAELIGYGRTKLNLALNMSVLPEELKRLVIEKLELPEDTFPTAPEVQAPSEFFADLSARVDEMLANQKQILELLLSRRNA